MLDALQWIANWFGDAAEGITGFFIGLLDYALGWFIVAKIKFYVWAVTYAWQFASGILEGLGANTLLATAFSALPETFASILRFFGVDQFLNMVMTASVTKYVLRLIGL